jgi:hypothetical protein
VEGDPGEADRGGAAVTGAAGALDATDGDNDLDATAGAPDPTDADATTGGPDTDGGPSAGFTPDVAARLRSYVYLLVDPRTGRPFSVGRGKGDRAFDGLDALRRADGDGAAARVREIEASGRSVRVDILRHGLSGEEARLVEATAVDALGLDPGGVIGAGLRRSAEAIAVELARPAKIKRSHPVVLLRVTGGDPPDPRSVPWRIGRRWTDLDSPRSPRWAVSVVDDLVHGVLRIDRWEPTGAPEDPGTRYRLHGERDPELEARYLGRSVATYRSAGAQNRVSYVWCGPHWVNRPR